MPAGVSWAEYLKFMSAAMLTMFAGSQFVHQIYNPLKDMDVLVQAEKKRMIEEYEQHKKETTQKDKS